jgi:hypothetical protein
MHFSFPEAEVCFKKMMGKTAGGVSMNEAKRLGVYIVDKTYGTFSDELETWDREAAKFKAELEAEYGTSFESTDLPGGVSVPAFVTWLVIEVWPTFDILFRGVEITLGLSGLWDLYQRLRGFLKRGPVLDRNAAAAVAYGKVREKLGKEPSSRRLKGYRELIYARKLETTDEITEIEDAREGEPYPFAVHAFQIEADQRGFRVYVGPTVKTVEVTATAKSRKPKRTATA